MLQSINTNSDLGARIRNVRHFLSVSGDEFARTLGTSKQAISLIENGRRIPPTTLLVGISSEYGIDARYLLGQIDSIRTISDPSGPASAQAPVGNDQYDGTEDAGIDDHHDPGSARTSRDALGTDDRLGQSIEEVTLALDSLTTELSRIRRVFDDRYGETFDRIR